MSAAHPWPDWKGSDPADVWHELCREPGGERQRQTLSAALTRLCSVAGPADLNLYVAAHSRLVKRGVMEYVATRWYCTQVGEHCPMIDPYPPRWAMPLLDRAKERTPGGLSSGPFHGPDVPLDARGGPTKGPMAMGTLIAYG